MHDPILHGQESLDKVVDLRKEIEETYRGVLELVYSMGDSDSLEGVLKLKDEVGTLTTELEETYRGVIELATSLERSEQKMDTMVRGSGLGLWEWQTDSGEFSVNPEWMRISGLEHEGQISEITAWDERIHPHDLAAVQQARLALQQGESTFFHEEHRIKSTVNDWHWVLSSGRAVEIAADGKPRRLAGLMLNIGSQKKTERKLHDINKQLEQKILEGARELRSTNEQLMEEVRGHQHAVQELHQARRSAEQANVHLEERVNERTLELQWVNRLLKTLGQCNQVIKYATTEFELLEKLCSEIVDNMGYPLVWVAYCDNDNTPIKPQAWAGSATPWFVNQVQQWQQQKAFIAEIQNCLNTAEPVISSQVFHQQFGAQIILPLESETVSGVLILHAANRHDFEHNESQLFKKLAHDVAYGIDTLRTRAERQGLQKQLQQAHKMEAIGQLTGGIAHDFNNMLSGILGFTSLAQNLDIAKESEKLTGYLNQVYQAGERARDLIAQMMVFSRVGKGGDIKPLSLNKEMNQVITMLRSMLPSSIELKFQDYDSQLDVLADSIQLQQIILNLCVNARDAMAEKGHLDIQLLRSQHIDAVCTSCHQSVQGEFAELRVSDDGSGIRPEHIERMFEPFFTTKEVGKGTGMGLSMVYGVMHAHNGHVIVKTAVGEGTCFRLLFPLFTGKISAELTTGRTSLSGRINGKSRSVLVVDDDETIASFITEYLTIHQYDVTCCLSSEEALKRFKENPHDYALVVTDQTMPKITGTEMAQAMLQIRPELPIILCTGYSALVDAEQACELGIKHYMNKPVSPDELLKTVSTLLDRVVETEEL